jgi:hypothetical protein
MPQGCMPDSQHFDNLLEATGLTGLHQMCDVESGTTRLLLRSAGWTAGCFRAETHD